MFLCFICVGVFKVDATSDILFCVNGRKFLFVLKVDATSLCQGDGGEERKL